MEMQELTIKRRQATGKEVAKRLRRAGEVPAILYGGAKPEPVVVDPKAVLKMIHGREGTTQLLALKFDGEAGGGRRMAIIRDLQFHPVTEHLLHVDLQEVSADRTITVRVAVRPVGRGPLGGVRAPRARRSRVRSPPTPAARRSSKTWAPPVCTSAAAVPARSRPAPPRPEPPPTSTSAPATRSSPAMGPASSIAPRGRARRRNTASTRMPRSRPVRRTRIAAAPPAPARIRRR